MKIEDLKDNLKLFMDVYCLLDYKGCHKNIPDIFINKIYKDLFELIIKHLEEENPYIGFQYMYNTHIALYNKIKGDFI